MVRVDYSGLDWSELGYEFSRQCKFCGYKHIMYCDSRDAMFCPSCNRWLEPKCRDPRCEFCYGRESTPILELHKIQYKNKINKH